MVKKLRKNSSRIQLVYCFSANLINFAVPFGKGEVVEWSITAVLKTVELKGSGGSNPSLSARKWLVGIYRPFFIKSKKTPKLRSFFITVSCNRNIS